jgi:hypothetical protein
MRATKPNLEASPLGHLLFDVRDGGATERAAGCLLDAPDEIDPPIERRGPISREWRYSRSSFWLCTALHSGRQNVRCGRGRIMDYGGRRISPDLPDRGERIHHVHTTHSSRPRCPAPRNKTERSGKEPLMISDCGAVRLCQTNTTAGACWIIGLGFHDCFPL